MLSTIVAFILLLGVLMFFHELGHYLAARRSGIEVEEFGVWGFPPRLVKLFTYDGTIFSINAIPLGAFVRMKGEDAADMSPGSFNAASAGARAFTLIAGPAMNLLLAVLFSVAGMMSGVPADVARPQVDAVPPGGVAAQVGVEPGDILLRAAGEPVYVAAATGDFLRLAELGEGDATGPSSGVEVIRKGTRITLAEAQDVTPQALLAETSYTPVLTTQITFVVEETPAAAAGLLPGDMVYAVNGERVTPERTLSDLVQEHLGETVTLTVLRGDEWMQVDVLARENPPPGQGAMGVGISGVVRLVSLPLGEAIWEGVAQITTYIYSVLALPVMLIAGELAPSDAGFTGPVGIAQLVGGAVNATADTGVWFPIFQLAALISAGLAVANMLPIPALDGGRLLFILFEKLRGRRVDPEKEGLIHLVGFALLLGLMVIITISDIRSGPQTIDWGRILGR